MREANVMTLNDWASEIHQNAVDHGWWESDREFAEVVALCHSELSEALEEDRNGRPLMYCTPCGENIDPERCIDCNGVGKPEGKAVEMVDCMIRILDYLAHVGVDVEHVLRIKHEYNKTRPYKHGKMF